MIPTLLLLATLCLPPGVPPLETLHATRGRVHDIEGQRATEHYAILSMIYTDDAGHAWRLFTLLGAIALVDDHIADDEATDWWIDPGLLSDDIPPKVQADPKSSCQWRRRGEHAQPEVKS